MVHLPDGEIQHIYLVCSSVSGIFGIPKSGPAKHIDVDSVAMFANFWCCQKRQVWEEIDTEKHSFSASREKIQNH